MECVMSHNLPTATSNQLWLFSSKNDKVIRMSSYLFLDETGDHGLKHLDPNFPIFLLCGCLFTEKALVAHQQDLDAIKMKYWKTTSVILHSRDIRKCEGPFQIFFDLSLKQSFYADLDQAMERAEFTVIAAAINKEEHIKKYGRLAHDPYDVSLSFIMERLVYCLDDQGASSDAKLIFEKRGYKEDMQLIAHFNSIRDVGTHFVSAERIQQRIIGCDFLAKKENAIGLQCADLCAYPLARSLVLKGEPSKAADIISKKIYRKGTKVHGLKIFP